MAECIRVLVMLSDGGAHRYGEVAVPLLRALDAYPGLEPVVARGEDDLHRLDGFPVVLAASDDPLTESAAGALAEHRRQGGGLVVLHSTPAAWARTAAGSAVLGWAPGDDELPETELAIAVLPGSQITARLDPEILVRDRLPQAGGIPEGATALLEANWHFSRRPAGFALGRLVWLGLGGTGAAYADRNLQKLVHRALREAAGVEAGGPVGVGLYGYGAIGREHATSATSVEGFRLAAVCDRSEARLREAEDSFGVRTHGDAAELLADPEVGLVVVGVPPVAHADAVLESLAAGKHVVCEKPFALRAEEADRMMAAAQGSGLSLTVYQSRRWDPDYVALRRAVAQGAVGDPFYMEAFIGGFGHPCSYWHSHEPISGGTIYDWGSHYFDWVLNLFSETVVSVSAQAHKRVWLDVTNSDQVRVDLSFEGGKQATFLQSDIAAALKPKWYLLGTAGAIVGDWRQEAVRSRAWTGDLVEERLAPSEAPAQLSILRPGGAGESHREAVALPTREAHGFYRNLADHLQLGEPLAVTPEQSRRNVAVMEAAARSIAAGGRPVELKA